MNLQDVHYDAFISYRHSERDIFVATTLQRKLENFKLPGILLSQLKGKNRIERIFRDQDELPLAANLSDPINQALKNSDYLLVICTPRLKESHWCLMEIKSFLELHGRDRILLILAEGEPKDSFPDVLLHETVEITEADGTKKQITKSIEPLAADVRGLSLRETRKKIDDAVLRIAATVLDLNYDDLKQRNREQRIRKLTIVWGSIIISVLLVAIVCIIMLIEISSQNRTIESQYATISEHADEITRKNTEILQQNGEISKQKEELKIQYEEAAKNYALSMSAASSGLMEEGKRIDALYAIRKAIPDTLASTDRPYTADGHLALADALAIYSSDKYYIPLSYYDAGTTVYDFRVSDDGRYLAIITSDNSLLVYDTFDDRLILGSESAQDEITVFQCYFIKNNLLLISDLYSSSVIDLNTAEATLFTDRSVESVLSDPENNRVYAFLNGSVIAYSLEDYSPIWSSDLRPASEDRASLSSTPVRMVLSCDKKTLFCTSRIYDEGVFVHGLDINDGTAIFCDTFDAQSEVFTAASESMLFISVNTDPYNYSEGPASNTLTAYDYKNNTPLWSVNCPNNLTVSDLLYSSASKSVIYIANNYIALYNSENGIRTLEAAPDSAFTCFTDISDNTGERYLAVTEADSLYLFRPASLEFDNITSATLLSAPKKNNFLAEYANDGMFLCFNNETTVTRYGRLQNPDTQTLGMLNNTLQISPNGLYQVRYEIYDDSEDYDVTIYLYNTMTCEKTKLDTDAYDFIFVGDNSGYLLTFRNDCLELFDTATGQLINTADYSDTEASFFGEISVTAKYIPFISNNNDVNRLTIISAESLEPVHIQEFSEPVPMYVLLSEENEIIVFIDFSTNKISVYNWDSDTPIAEMTLKFSFINSFLLSSDGRYLFLEYRDGSADILDIPGLSRITTLYDIPSDAEKFFFLPELDSYVVSGSQNDTWILLNRNLEIYSTVINCLGFSGDLNSFIIYTDEKICSVPYYDYDTLVKKADELLDKYECSEATKIKYKME